MPMDKEKYEAILNELLSPDLEQSRRTELLQELRVDYTQVHTDFEEVTTKADKLQKDNSDLVVSNSKLFRQLGVVSSGDEEVEQQDFSETVTLSEIERGLEA